MAIVEEELGNLQKALELYDKSLEIKLKCLGGDHADVATSHFNIGLVYQRLGDHEKALFHFNTAHDIFKRSLRPDHRNTQHAARAIQKLQIASYGGPEENSNPVAAAGAEAATATADDETEAAVGADTNAADDEADADPAAASGADSAEAAAAAAGDEPEAAAGFHAPTHQDSRVGRARQLLELAEAQREKLAGLLAKLKGLQN